MKYRPIGVLSWLVILCLLAGASDYFNNYAATIATSLSPTATVKTVLEKSAKNFEGTYGISNGTSRTILIINSKGVILVNRTEGTINTDVLKAKRIPATLTLNKGIGVFSKGINGSITKRSDGTYIIALKSIGTYTGFKAVDLANLLKDKRIVAQVKKEQTALALKKLNADKLKPALPIITDTVPPVTETVQTIKAAGIYKKGTIYRVEANPQKGFYWGYYLYIPETVGTEAFVFVEPNNAPTKNVDYSKIDEGAKNTVNYQTALVTRLKMPMLVPAFVGSDDITTPNSYYPHALNRQAMIEKRQEFARFDNQLIAMFEDMSEKLRAEGISLKSQFVINGFSDSANFADRFTAIHPEKVKVSVSGGINLFLLPLETWKDVPFNYPFGTADFAQLFGTPFNKKAYDQVHKLFYRSLDDSKDPIYGVNFMTSQEKDFILANLGAWQGRVNRLEEILKASTENFQVNYYDGIGHTVPKEVVNDLANFIERNLSEKFVVTEHYQYSQSDIDFGKLMQNTFKAAQYGGTREDSGTLQSIFAVSGGGTSPVNITKETLSNIQLTVIVNTRDEPISNDVQNAITAIGFTGSNGAYMGWFENRFWIYIKADSSEQAKTMIDKTKIINAVNKKTN